MVYCSVTKILYSSFYTYYTKITQFINNCFVLRQSFYNFEQ